MLEDPIRNHIPSLTARARRLTRTSSQNQAKMDAALKATQVICVAYTNAFSVDGDSLVDLQIGCRHNVVSSNQSVLDRAEVGSLVVVTSQTGHMVIGVLGAAIINCNLWTRLGGHSFNYAREFTPITDIVPIALVRDKWIAVCDVHEVSKQPRYLFHSRFCGYGTWYVPALHDALRFGIFPSTLQTGSNIRTVF